MNFARSRERREYAEEIDGFIANEIGHARRLVQRFGTDDHRDRRFVASAALYTKALTHARSRITSLYQPSTRSSGTATDSEPSLNEYVEHFPDIIRDLTTALFQRVEAEPTRAFALYSHHSSFAPSEVTLEYPVTIRAAEAVNEFYHDRVRNFYPNPKGCEPPLVNLSGGTVAVLRERRSFALEMTRGTFSDPLDLKRILAISETILDLSCITLPRWSSQHIRTYALAAHEHLHRVLSVAQFVTSWTKARYLFRDGAKSGPLSGRDGALRQPGPLLDIDFLNSEEARDFYFATAAECEPVLGERIVQMAILGYDFFHRIWQFYRDWLTPKRPMGPQVGNAEANAEEIGEAEPLRTIAFWHSLELLADIGALVIAGPAFALAFRTVYPPQRTSEALNDLFRTERTDVFNLLPKHPPTLLRVRLHIDMLDMLGFHGVAKDLNAEFDKEWNEGKVLRDGFLDEYAKYLLARKPGARDSIENVLDAIGKNAGAALCYDLVLRGDSDAAHRTESELLAWWQEIARRIEVEGKFLPQDMQHVVPPDAINAIWWKRALEGGEPKNRLAWRVALRNYRG